MPRVSVVIPTYNRSDYIEVAIQSVLQQTYRDFEIIVCDDRSTDNTVEIVRSIQAASELPVRIEVLPYNLGVSAARNKAIFLSHGELIAFLDSDDSWRPEKLEKQVDFLDRNPGFIGVGCIHEQIWRNGTSRGEYSGNFNLNASNELFQMLYRCYITTSCFLVKKEALILAGLFDLTLQKSQDRDLWWRLPRLGRIGYLNESLVDYMVHPVNISTKMRDLTGKTYIPIIKKTVWYYRDKLTVKEKRKILSNAHLLVAEDAASGDYIFLPIRHAIAAMLYGAHYQHAIKLIMSNVLRFLR